MKTEKHQIYKRYLSMAVLSLLFCAVAYLVIVRLLYPLFLANVCPVGMECSLNMFDGYISLVSLIFIFKSVAVAPVSIFFVLFMYCIELLVAFLQAYVFTLLSALFIGMATAEAEHH